MKKRAWLKTAGLIVLIAGAGCSKRDVPPPPKTQPELLLEIYDAARKQEYNATLLKLQKMRALDPTSVFLAELENTVRFNRLTARVNAYLQMGRFDDALSALHEYEKRYGYSDATDRAKERLFRLASMDRQIRRIKQARRSEEMEKEIRELKKLTQNIKLSRKIGNFLKNRESMLPELRKQETVLMHRELLAITGDRLAAGEKRSGAVLAAICALTVPDQEGQILSVLHGPDMNKTSK